VNPLCRQPFLQTVMNFKRIGLTPDRVGQQHQDSNACPYAEARNHGYR
jgi:hypothetical protein